MTSIQRAILKESMSDVVNSMKAKGYLKSRKIKSYPGGTSGVGMKVAKRVQNTMKPMDGEKIRNAAKSVSERIQRKKIEDLHTIRPQESTVAGLMNLVESGAILLIRRK